MRSLVDSFTENGYLILEGLFSEAELAPVSDEIDSLIEGRSTYIPAKDLIYEPTDASRLRNAFRLHLYNEMFLDFAKTKKLTDVLAAILGSPLRLYGSQLFAKPAKVGTAVPKHQDMAYWPFQPYELVSAWIALDDSTIANGCVRMLAGSQKSGLMPHAKSGVAGNSLGLVDSPALNAFEEHAIEVTRGSCVLHHCLTVHRSEPNTSPLPRRGLIYVYMSPNVVLTEPERMHGPALFPEVA